MVVLRLDGGLFFATSDALEDRVREVIHSTPDLTGIVLDCGGIDFIDSQGSATLKDILDLTADSGIVLHLARLKPGLRVILERDQVLERIGPDRVHGNIRRALQAHLRAPDPPPDDGRGSSPTATP